MIKNIVVKLAISVCSTKRIARLLLVAF